MLRKRIGYVVLGIWLGFAVGFFGGTLPFGHQIIAAIGSLGFFVLVVIVLPLAGGLIGYLAGKSYWMQKRKFTIASTDGVEELKN